MVDVVDVKKMNFRIVCMTLGKSAFNSTKLFDGYRKIGETFKICKLL